MWLKTQPEATLSPEQLTTAIIFIAAVCDGSGQIGHTIVNPDGKACD